MFPRLIYLKNSAFPSVKTTFDKLIDVRNEEKNSAWWHKTPKTAKITKKHNGHTRGKFVLIILPKKREYFKAFSGINQRWRYFISHTTSYKALKFSTVLV